MYIIINERERARERETEYYVAFGRRIVDEEAKIRQKKFTPTIFPFVDSGPIFLGFSRESLARDMWCFIAYVYNRREKEREREREGERESEREREIERDRRREYLAGSYYLQWDENCITYVFTRQFSRVLTPGHSSLGFSRESPAGDMSLMFIMGNLFPS